MTAKTLTDVFRAVQLTVGYDISSTLKKEAVVEWTNEGIVEVLKETHCTVTPTEVTFVPNDTGLYSLDELAGSTEEVPIWVLAVDSIMVQSYLLQGSRLLEYLPMVDENTVRFPAHGKLLQSVTATLGFVLAPAEVEDGDDEEPDDIPLPYDAYHLLRSYVCWKAGQQISHQASNMGELFHQEYLTGLQDYNANKLKKFASQPLPPIRVKPYHGERPGYMW